VVAVFNAYGSYEKSINFISKIPLNSIAEEEILDIFSINGFPAYF
jgi:hypothetical protein